MRAIDADAFVRKIRKQYCEDCVRRKGIKNGKMQYLYEIGGVPCRACEIEDMLNEVEDAPPIHPEPHWIPVTKPPTDRMICYVTLKDKKDKSRQNWVAEMIYTPWDGFDLMDGIEAIAWMPKQYPEPYKGVTE